MPRPTTVRLVATSTLVGALTIASIAPALASTDVPVSSQETPSTNQETTAPDVPAEPVAPTTEPTETAAPAAPEAASPVDKPVSALRKSRAATLWTVQQLNQGKVVLRRGDRGPAVLQVQKRLNILGLITAPTAFYSPQTAQNVARFNEKFRGFEYMEDKTVNKFAWRRLVGVTSRGDRVPRLCKVAVRAVCVSKSQKIVRLYVRGKQVMGLDARFGRPSEPTRNGKKYIFRKVKDDVSSQYHSKMPWSNYFDGGQAIHFSYYFRSDGYWGASHGCINLRDWSGAIKFWKSVPLGTLTIIYK